VDGERCCPFEARTLSGFDAQRDSETQSLSISSGSRPGGTTNGSRWS
jgi:hypothetical protein